MLRAARNGGPAGAEHAGHEADQGIERARRGNPRLPSQVGRAALLGRRACPEHPCPSPSVHFSRFSCSAAHPRTPVARGL